MIILYLILPIALVFACAAVAAFAWTVRSGQLDDVETPPRRILFEDEAGEPSSATVARRMPSRADLARLAAVDAVHHGRAR